MKTKEIIELMDFISGAEDLKEVKIETEEIKLSVKKAGAETKIIEQVISAAPAAATVAAPAAAPTLAAAPAAPATPAPAPASNTVTVNSPMIGTFYRSANPESPMFASVGDKIVKGQTVCIIEAMKLFNEIESEVSGTIVEVLVENAQPVEFDQPLFVVDPS